MFSQYALEISPVHTITCIVEWVRTPMFVAESVLDRLRCVPWIVDRCVSVSERDRCGRVAQRAVQPLWSVSVIHEHSVPRQRLGAWLRDIVC